MKLWIFVAFSLLTFCNFLTPSLGTDDFCMTIGVWYPGNGIPFENGTTIRWGYNFLECMELCEGESDCVGVLFNPEDNPPQGTTKCYLKSAMIKSDLTRSSSLIGWKRECTEELDCFDRGIWYPGNGIQDSDGNTARSGYNLVGCRDACLEVDECVGITYKPIEKTCYLKSAMIASDEARPDLISWRRDCNDVDESPFVKVIKAVFEMIDDDDNNEASYTEILAYFTDLGISWAGRYFLKGQDTDATFTIQEFAEIFTSKVYSSGVGKTKDEIIAYVKSLATGVTQSMVTSMDLLVLDTNNDDKIQLAEFTHENIPENLAELYALKFELMDTDESQGISMSELSVLMEAFGLDLSDETLEGLMDLEDTNGDDEVSLEELEDGIMYWGFHLIDGNGDNEIDGSEISDAASNLIDVIVNFVTEQLDDTAFDNIDTDDDGLITEDEMNAALENVL